jgi:predicted NBD/HSP70 family sugar kinase
MVAVARRLLRDVINEQTFMVGLTTTGFVDPANRRILLSSAFPGEHLASLDKFLEVVGDTPLAVENDMHALAARWLQEHDCGLDQDVLLIYLDDGQLGSALLVRGEPNWGCLVGGNELGHTRLPVETATCYCGHRGCMERICSTEFVRDRGMVVASLLAGVRAFDGTEPAMVEMIDLLATGLANAINFVRPHRVVLVSQFTRSPRFIESLMQAVRTRVMTALTERVQFHYWDEAAAHPGEAAAWLALAALYYPNWTKAILGKTTGNAPR